MGKTNKERKHYLQRKKGAGKDYFESKSIEKRDQGNDFLINRVVGVVTLLRDATYTFSSWGLSLMTPLLKNFSLGPVMTILLVMDLQLYCMRALLSSLLTPYELLHFINFHITQQ